MFFRDLIFDFDEFDYEDAKDFKDIGPERYYSGPLAILEDVKLFADALITDLGVGIILLTEIYKQKRGKKR